MSRPAWLVYTEDSGKDADAVLFALIRKLAARIEPGTRTNLLDLRPAHGEPRRAMRAHAWKGHEVLRRALVKELATRLKMGDIVVFHHDGDIPWQSGPGSPKHDRDLERLLHDVRRLLADDTDPGTFLRLVPHYSIESWLYLNRGALRALVDSGKHGPELMAWLDQNDHPTTGLDHVSKPKDACPAGDRHNQLLAVQAFPADEVARKSPSWAHTEQTWAARTAVRAALRATWDQPTSGA